jgi:hypothetical protein
MKNECKVELIEGLKQSATGGNYVSFSGGEEKSLLQQKEKLDRLFILYKQELEQNINVTNNFPIAFRYVKEVQHEFQYLLKYSLDEKFTSLLAYRTIYTGNTLLTFNNKGLTVTPESQKLKYLVCKQIIDFTILKSCLLKELKDDYFTQSVFTRNMLRWNGTHTDLVEVVQFLQETKIIYKENGTLTLKEAILAFSRLFDLKITSIYSKIGKQRQRRQGKSTKVYQIWTTYQQNKN